MVSKRRLFGTDGVRGVANIEPMTAEMALKLGRAIAYVFKNEDRRHSIVIGKDTRLSGYMLESAMMAGICSMGVDTLMVGPLPTPGIAFITSNMRADAGVVISASHNPYQDNGIKFFSRDGFKLPDDIELKIEEFVLEDQGDTQDPTHRPTAEAVGKAYRVDDAIGRYIVFAKSTFASKLTLDGIKVVVDCANGAAYKVAPSVFGELGATVTAIGIKPDGANINKDCGPLHLESLVETVKASGAHVGIAIDGDGDRCIMVDESGGIVDGDHIMSIIATSMLKKGTLKKDTLVATIMSNSGLEPAISSAGGTVVRTDVGDRYVVQEMLKNGYNLGGEQSGHVIFFDHTTTGDGVITALQVLEAMVLSGRPLSELSAVMQSYPQVLVNVTVKEKKELSSVSAIQAALTSVEGRLKGNGRVFIRYSGTEPLARVTIEGPDSAEIEAMAAEIAAVVTKELG